MPCQNCNMLHFNMLILIIYPVMSKNHTIPCQKILHMQLKQKSWTRIAFNFSISINLFI